MKNFFKYIKHTLTTFEIKGRATRKEYIYFYIFNLVLLIIFFILALLVGVCFYFTKETSSDGSFLLIGVFSFIIGLLYLIWW